MNIHGKRILICPLNWGIGHATRMVAYARQLEAKGNTIFVAGATEVLDIFEDELPHVHRSFLSDVHVSYDSHNKTVRKLLLQSPKFLISLIKQHYALKKLLKTIDVDIIISDNRPSLWHHKTTSYYVTHQPSIMLTDGWHWAEGLASAIHLWFIKKFDACLIPDIEGEEAIAGDLIIVQDKSIKVHYIGWLSRFQLPDHKLAKESYTLLILSGVEPTRTQLNDEVVARFDDGKETLIIAGGKSAITKGNIITLPYVRTEALLPLILSAKKVICRSGFSMVTDLKVLDCDAELIATPGQPEQEYLSKRHSS